MIRNSKTTWCDMRHRPSVVVQDERIPDMVRTYTQINPQHNLMISRDARERLRVV